MYTLKRARYRLDRRGGRWIEADLSTALVSTLSATYGDVYLYVEYPAAGGTVVKALHWLNATNLIVDVEPTVTISQWLTDVGNTTLPFDATLPDETVRLVRYAQAWHSGYNAQPVATNGHVSQDTSKFAKQDLVLTHTKHTPEEICTNAMVSVNGYFHLCDYDANGVRVYGGNSTIRMTNDNQIGIYSFAEIGTIKYVQITDDMIKPQAEGAPLWNAAYIVMPDDIDLTNKTVLFVGGGYLNVLSDVYSRVNERVWRISFGSMQFLNRYLESVKQIDMSSLNLTYDDVDTTKFLVSELKDDAVIRAYLKLPQSFMVIVDSPSLFQSYEPIQYLKLPGRYVSGQNEQMPLVGAYGKMLDYHVIKEPGSVLTPYGDEQLFVYCAVENKRYRYIAHTYNWQDFPIVDGGRYPAWAGSQESAFFRVLGVDG